MSELNASPLFERVFPYEQTKETERVLPMENDWITKAAYFYVPQGSRYSGKFRKMMMVSFVIQLDTFVNNNNLIIQIIIRAVRPQSTIILMPVSYTHLDVYKRQV